MVANHFRWDFIGLSTDDKPTADNPRVADGSTYYESDTSKVYVWYKTQWYEKEAGGSYELPIASASTLGGVKVGEGLSIDSGGVLSASGGGGGDFLPFKVLTSADYNYPEDNPEYLNMTTLPIGIYRMEGYQGLNWYDEKGGSSSSLSTPITLIKLNNSSFIWKADGSNDYFCTGTGGMSDEYKFVLQ